ncbi:MAG: metal ABC transporter permease [Gemmataceae bacterium]|nr:metal ABC transporter permease [Gemmataceae bacterium]
MNGPEALQLPLAARMIVVGILAAVPCALLGCYLVLRRMSLLGDAISHAVLPGIALAFLLSGQVTGMPIVLGAIAVGVLTAVLTQTVHRFANVPEDASLGVVFTSLFAVGVILLNRVAHGTDLDPDCVLYGRFELTVIRTEPLMGLALPTVVQTLLPTLGLALLFIVLLWKELKAASFDPALATAMGLSAAVVHYLLMGMVAAVTVASFEAVGSILVVAMLIVPAATAQLLTDRLGRMLLLSAGVAVVSAVGGYVLASEAVFDSQMSAMMGVVAGGQFVLAVLLAPRYGVLSKVVRNARLAVRIAAEDILAALYRGEEARARGETPIPPAITGWTRRLARWVLRRQGQVEMGPGGELRLTEPGRRRAESLVRSHRLWEAYLGENFELPLDHLHEAAERMEHFVGPELQKELEEELHAPVIDPHGKPIPPSPDRLPGERGV